MRRVTYKSVLQRVSQMAAGKVDPSAVDAATINAFINRRYKQAFEYYFWPELMRVERRQYRASWDAATAYAAPSLTAAVEVYHVASGKYAQALRASTNEEPFAEVGGEWFVNDDYWAECQSSYSADDWATGETLAAGDERRNPATDRVYACHTAHTTGGSFDVTKFGVLTDFVRSVALEQADETPIGELEIASTYNPRTVVSGCNYFWIGMLLEDDIIFGTAAPARPWLRYRVRPVAFTGGAYDATVSYATDEQFYYTDGDYWKALETTVAGDTPVSEPTKFERLDFPYIFQEAVAQGAYADFIGKTDGQQEKWGQGENEFRRLLDLEIDKIERQQQQNNQLNVRVYA